MSQHPNPLAMDRRRFLQWSALIGVGAAGGLLLGCGPSQSAPQGGSGPAPAPAVTGPHGDIVIIQGVDIESLDPHVTTSSASKGVMWAMYDKLAERDADMKIIPGLAESWKLVDDTTWEFKLRDNVYFHNGEKFGAQHVKDTVARFVDPNVKNVYGSLLKPVKEVKVIDERTVQFITDGPYALLLEVLSNYCEILPNELTSGKSDITKVAVGTGPYKFKEYTPGEKLVMTAGDKPHFSGQPKAASITWRPVPEAATRIVELKSGHAHLITPVSPLNAAEIESDPNSAVLKVAQQSTQIIVFNIMRPYFQDKRVRQALNLAVDVDGIIKNINKGAGVRANGPFGPGVPGYDASLKPYPYDPEKAKKLLADAGFGSGFELTLTTPNGRYLNDKLISEAIADQWSKVGVKAKVDPQEWGAFVQGVLGKKWDAFFFSQGGILTDATASTNFDSSKKGGPWEGYDNPAANQLIQQAAKTMDAGQREKLYQQLSAIILEDAPWLFLYYPQSLYGVAKSLKGWQPSLDGTVRLNGMTL